MAGHFDEDPVAQKFDLASFKARAVEAYARMVERRRAQRRKHGAKYLLTAADVRMEDGVMNFRQDSQNPGHPDRPLVE
jgi:hypothetical protein